MSDILRKPLCTRYHCRTIASDLGDSSLELGKAKHSCPTAASEDYKILVMTEIQGVTGPFFERQRETTRSDSEMGVARIRDSSRGYHGSVLGEAPPICSLTLFTWKMEGTVVPLA